MAKMLICDDEAGLRSVLKRYATFEGHEVTEASNGMEAVNLCRSNTFDIIIMDIMMPELDGFSAVKEIRKFSDTPVLIFLPGKNLIRYWALNWASMIML